MGLGSMISNNGKEVAVVAYNNSDGTHTVDFYLDGEKTALSKINLPGTINGFKALKTSGGGWTWDGNYVGFKNLSVGTVSESNDATVQVALDRLNIDPIAQSKVTLPETVNDSISDNKITWSTTNTDIVRDDGTVIKSPENVTDVKFKATVNVKGKDVTAEKTVKILPAALKGGETFGEHTLGDKNLFGDNYDFSKGYDGWSTGANVNMSEAGFKLVTSNDVKYVSPSTSDLGTDKIGSIKKTVPVTMGKTYLLAVTANKLNKDYSGVKAGATEETKKFSNDEWSRQTYEFVAQAPEVTIHFRWMTKDVSAISSIELYEETDVEAYTFEKIEYPANGVEYTTIGLNDLPFPDTATATYKNKSDATFTYAAPLNWDIEEKITGSTNEAVELTGTYSFDGQSGHYNVKLNVLPEMFKIDGEMKKDSRKTFPNNLIIDKGILAAEFDFTTTNVNNVWIYLSEGNNEYGQGGAGFGLGKVSNSATQALQLGSSEPNNHSTEEISEAILKNDTKYHVVMQLNMDNHTYGVSVFDPSGSVIHDDLKTGKHNFRQDQPINTLRVCSGGGPTISNIRFYTDRTIISYKEGDKVLGQKAVDPNSEYSARTYYSDGDKAIYNFADGNSGDGERIVEVTAVKDDTKVPASKDGFFTPNDSDFEPYINSANENDICVYGATDADKFGLLAKILEKDPSAKGDGTVSSTKPTKKTRVGYVVFKAPEGFKKGDKATLTLNAYKSEGVKGSKLVAIPTDYDIGDTKDGTSITGFDLQAKEEYYFSDALDDNPTGPVTIDVTGVQADENGNIKLLIAVPNGVIWFSIMERAGFNGTHEGKVAYIEVTPVEHPDDVTAELGWNNTDKKFAINVKYGAKPGDAVVVNGEEQKADGEGLTISTDLTNKVYTVAASLKGAWSDTIKTSIYSLVVDAIMADDSAETNPDKIKAASEVISAGGIYLNGDKLDDTTDKIIDYNKEENTVTMSDAAQALKIGFTVVDGNVYLGSGENVNETAATANVNEAGKVYKKATIDIEKNTITFAAEDAYDEVATNEAITLSLDAVNIEFVETLVEELEAAGADADIALTPEL